MTSLMFRRSCLACALCLIVPAAAWAQKLVTAPGPGAPSTVRVVDASGADQSFLVYDPAFLGGVRVAQGDVNGDGVPDIVTAAGPGGGPQVRVWNGTDLSEIGGFIAYDATFTGGVFVTAGDVNGDGRADIITGAGAGGAPRVRIWDAATLTEIAGFDAYDSTFHGGVTVAAADVDGDGLADIVTGTGPGGGPRVRVWNGATRAELGSFDAYNASFEGGVNVAAGDIDGDGLADILTAAGPGGTPQVRAWRGADFTAIGEGFIAYEPGFSGGIAVGVVDLDADGVNEIVTGPMSGSPLVRVWSGATFSLVGEYLSSDPGSGPGGTAVASESEDHSRGNLRFVSATETTFAVGSPGTFTVRTKGGAKPALTVSGTLPAGVTFVDNGNRTATLAGTPAAGTGGTYPLVFTADNGSATPVTQNFTLTVAQGPAITSANATTFTVGVAGTFTVTTTGTPTPAITATGALPSAVTFTDNGNGTATLAGTPGAGTAGTYPLTITATNSAGTATQNFTLTVQLACPTITITPTVMPEGLYQIAYAGVDFNQTGSTGSSFTWSATGLPAGLTIDTSTGVVSGTPTTTVLNAAVVVTVTDNFGCSGTLNTAMTVRPFTDNDIYSGGVGNTQFAVGIAGIATPNVFVNDNVKNGDNGPGTLTVTFNAPASGSVTEGPTDGTFIYTPNVAFAGPSDSFTYTLTDGNGVINTGTVTINLSGIVWYVNSAGGAGDGRSQNPFNTLTAAAAPSGSGSVIYVHTGGGATTGNLAMDANQTLHGQGATFTLNGLTIPSATAPTLTGTVTLASNDIVRAVSFAGAGVAMTGSGITGPVTIDQVSVNGGTTALNLTNVSGAVTVNGNSSFTNTTGAEVLINGGTGSADIGATISSNAGRSIEIQNRTGGTVAFSGPITDTGQGILLNSNPGSTINFTGGLSLNTGANPAFTATAGGTVSATQNNTTVVNTITTTTGTALNVANTTIGASGLTFRSIASNGAVNGILLDSTGTGGLTVTGNSAGLCGGQVANSGATVTAPVAGDCSGGAILGSTGAGVSLTGTGAVSLTRVRIAGGGDDGITGTDVGGLTLASTLIENNGNGVGECGIDLTNLSGTGGITSSTIRGSSEHNVTINNTSATLTSFNVTNSQFATNSIVTGDDGILLLTDFGGNMTAGITQSAFTDNKGDHFQAATTASATGTINVTFSNNTLLTTAANDPNVIGGGITINPSGSADLNFTIANNNIQQAFDDAINLNLGTASTAAASLVGTISNNSIGTAADPDSGSESSNTITVTSNGAGTTTVAVTNNVLRQYGNGHGIFLDNKEGSSTLNATVTGNDVDNPGTFALNGIHVNAGATAGPPIDNGVTCAAITGNTVTNGGLGTADIRLRQRFNTTIRLPGYGGANDDTTAVNGFVSGNNGGAEVTSTQNVAGGGGGFVGGAACTLPQ